MSRAVTVDTGGPDDVFVGSLVVWVHTPRGGYGFSMPVDATVVAVTKRRIRIRVTTKSGTSVVRSVDAANLRWGR